jgi:hypothetical protein
MISTPSIAKEGFTLARNVLHTHALAALVRLIEDSVVPEEGRGGVRNLLDVPAFRELANSAQVRALIEPILGAEAFPIRGILFDKNDNANWKVPWHQDVTIAVTNRVEADGYGPWSVKAGVIHVQPPASVLQKMISIRMHLDDCPAENGALRVLPGTHLEGKLSQAKIDEYVAELTPVVCEAQQGDALMMHPLLLHASSAASLPKHRRVLHFDYANIELSPGLQWRERRAIAFAGSAHA